MHRIEDQVLAAVAAGMTGDDLATAADHDLADVAAQPDIAVTIGDGHGIVVGLVADQCLRAHPPSRLIAGLEGCSWKVGHGLQIPFQPLPDLFVVTPEDVGLPLAAFLFQPVIVVVPRREARNRYHEVAARIPDQPFDAALVVALARAAITIADQVVGQEPAEQLRPLASPIRQDARHEAFVVVVEHRHRHPAKEGKGMNMAVDPGLGRRRRIGPDVTGVAVRQIEGEEVRLLLDTADDDRRLTEVRLAMPRRMRQRHEHLATPPFPLAHVGLDDRVTAGEPVLVAQPFENPLGRMPLLAVTALIPGKPGVDDLGEAIQLRTLDLSLAPVARRHREPQHLPDTVA